MAAKKCACHLNVRHLGGTQATTIKK